MNETSLRFCGYCGSPMGKTDLVCGYCGMRQVEAVSSVPRGEPTSAPADNGGGMWKTEIQGFSEPSGFAPMEHTTAFPEAEAAPGRFDRVPAAPRHTVMPSRIPDPEVQDREPPAPGEAAPEAVPVQEPLADDEDFLTAVHAALYAREPLAQTDAEPANPTWPAEPSAVSEQGYALPTRTPASCPQPGAPMPRREKGRRKEKKRISAWLLLPAALLLMAAAAAATWYILGGGRPEAPKTEKQAQQAEDPAEALAVEYAEYIALGDAGSADSLSFADCEAMSDAFAEDRKEQGDDDFTMNGYYREYEQKRSDELTARYGKDAKAVNFQAVYVQEWTEDDLREWKENFGREETWSAYYDLEQVTKAATVTVCYIVEGEKRGEAVLQQVTVALYGGEWRILRLPSFAEDGY